MASRCRLCAEEKPLNEVECTIKDQQTNIRQMLLDCCRWSTFESGEYENLSKIVCKECFVSLEKSWEFANNVAISQQRLLDYSNDVCEAESQPLLEDETACVAFDFKMDSEFDVEEKVDDYFDAGEDHMEDNYDRDSSSEEGDWKDGLKEEPPLMDAEAIETEEFSLPPVETGPKYNIMDHILPDECNPDGTIYPAAIQRLQLPNWSIVQYHCYVCKTIKTNSMEFRQHMFEAHPDDEFRYKCIFCNREFKSQRAKPIPDHVKNRHLRYLRNCCRHCGQYYWDLKLMRKHTKANKRPTHKGQFLCDTCGKEFKSYHPLIAHVRLLHSVDERPTFECYMCRRTFSSKYRLKDHMSVHMTTETATYTCGICHKVLPRKNSLRRHSLIHTNVYAHECTACGKAFRRKKELTVHSRIHTGEKPYGCTYCDYRSTDGANLNKHMKLKHGATYYKPKT